MLESKIQSKIIKKLENEGYFIIKIIRCNKAGIPDLLVVDKNNIATFIEVKQPKGVLSQIQKYRIEEMKAKGLNVKIWQDYGIDFEVTK
jgi:Holliday junction resolvase-like predicted endonuclease